MSKLLTSAPNERRRSAQRAGSLSPSARLPPAPSWSPLSLRAPSLTPRFVPCSSPQWVPISVFVTRQLPAARTPTAEHDVESGRRLRRASACLRGCGARGAPVAADGPRRRRADRGRAEPARDLQLRGGRGQRRRGCRHGARHPGREHAGRAHRVDGRPRPRPHARHRAPAGRGRGLRPRGRVGYLGAGADAGPRPPRRHRRHRRVRPDRQAVGRRLEGFGCELSRPAAAAGAARGAARALRLRDPPAAHAADAG